jgi:hypothetical protein
MSSDTESNGRDSKGRFAKGNPGGPGGSRRKAFVLRKAIEEAITEEHVEAIVRPRHTHGARGRPRCDALRPGPASAVVPPRRPSRPSRCRSHCRGSTTPATARSPSTVCWRR